MTPANICSAGYVCYSGANTPNPTDAATYGGIVCPAGFYCPQLTTAVPGLYSVSAAGVVTDNLPQRC